MLKNLEVEGATPALREFDHPKNTADDEYVDITGFLDQLGPIVSYRKANGIRRKRIRKAPLVKGLSRRATPCASILISLSMRT